MTAASNRLAPRKKLKDSCTACAVAKVKCNRDKPTCTRCQDRSLTCFYAVSQRSGRRSTASLANTGAEDVSSKNNASPSPSKDDSPCRTPNQLELVNTAPSSSAPSPKTDIQTLKIYDEDLIQDSSFGYFDMVDFSPQPPLEGFDFDIDMSNGIDFNAILPPSPTISPTISADTLQTTASSFWASNFPLSAQTGSTTNSGHAPQGTTWNTAPASSATKSQPFQAFSSQPNNGFSSPVLEHPTNMMDTCCLTKTSQSLTKLRARKSRCVSAAMDSANLGHGRPTVAQIIVANRKHFQSTVDVLNCTCASDRHILFMVALIIFNIIAEYGEAALPLQQPERYQTLPDLTTMAEAPKSESPRLQAHLILGELYRVVRMIELFAIVHRQLQTDGDISMLGGSNGLPHQPLHDDAIPVSIFVQMEADLRERLRVARGSTLEILRRY